MRPYELVLSKVPDPIPLSDHSAKFCCVCHEDSNPSATVTEGDDGKVLFHCFGCNAGAPEMVKALGLEMSDLFVSRQHQPKPKSAPKGFPTADEAMRCYQRRLGTPFKVWDYRDASGKLVLQVGRFNQPDGSKEFRPVSVAEDGLWYCKAPDQRPLYNLPALLAADRDTTVYVVEGEKACDAAISIGLLATTSMNGAKSPKKTDWSPIEGRNIVILPDNDDPGRQYAKTVARILQRGEPA